MHALPNGDWRNDREIEWYLPDGSTVDVDVIAPMMAAWLVQVCASKKYTIWSRHRWTKGDGAMDQVCLLESCQSLLPTAFHGGFAE